MVLQECTQVEPAWLTEKLRAAGALHQGHVSHIECDRETFNKGFVSNIAVLRLHYSPDATGERPPSLILKSSKLGLHPELLQSGSHEVEFYRAVAGMTGLPLPVCYDAASDPESHASHIVMQDLSPTHFQRPLPLPPSVHHCELIVSSLARLHARWWNSPRLGVELGKRLDEAQAQAIIRRLEGTLPAFFDFLGDSLLPQQRRAYEQIMASDLLPRRTERLCALRQVTLIHGDAHTGNILLPRDPTREPVALIDWHLWGIDMATIDLAFLMALHWSPQRRALLEQPLLQRYLTSLQEDGVSGYGWDDLWTDYRTAVIIMTLIPIGQFRRNSPTGVIWFGLQDSLAAFEDLHCAELL